MAKLEVNNALVQTIIQEVAPLVSRFTGWSLDLPHLRSRVLPREQGYEEIFLGRIKQLGVQGWEEIMPGVFERVIEYMVEQNVCAAYMHIPGEILVIGENVDDSNMEGLKVILGHELVHRGQHIAHGKVFAQVDNLLVRAFNELKSESMDIKRIQLYIEQIQPVMTLLESHAAYIQEQLKQACYPGARVESHYNVASLLMRMIGAQKISQYTEGLPQVAAAVAGGDVNRLYASFGD